MNIKTINEKASIITLVVTLFISALLITDKIEKAKQLALINKSLIDHEYLLSKHELEINELQKFQIRYELKQEQNKQ